MLGKLMAKVIEDEERPMENNVLIKSESQRGWFERNQIWIIVICVLLFLMALFCIYQWKKKRDKLIRKQKREEKKQKNADKINLYQQYEDDAILEELIDAD